MLLDTSLKIDWMEILWSRYVSAQYGDDGWHWGTAVGLLAESRFEKPTKKAVNCARIIEGAASATIRKIASFSMSVRQFGFY